MKQNLKVFVSLIFIVTGCSHALANSSNQPKQSVSLLFIGNSFTGANYLPSVLQAIAQANQRTLHFAAEIKNGTSLYQHWETGFAQQKLASKAWDFVVLQDASGSAFEHPQKTIEYGTLFAELAQKQKARTLLFNTWAYNGIPAWVESYQFKSEAIREGFKAFVPTMCEKTNALYQQLALKSNASQIPIGQAWQKLKTTDATINLYAKDNSHPSGIGTYLSALMLYQAIFDSVPDKLPLTLETQPNQQRLNEKMIITISQQQAELMLEAIQSVKI